jgi:hypothetical protein
MIRLRRIESNIQQSAYRVDRSAALPPSVVDRFVQELCAWKDSIPEDSPLQDTEQYSFDGYVYYMIYYYKTLRLLLYPHITTANINKDILVKCAEACGGVCRAYKNLHRQTSVGFSLIALYSVFLSGLNLVYCIWLSPKEVYKITTSNDLNSCSIVLYVITERWPGAKKYRDAFESIKQCVLDLIESSDQPRKPLINLNPGLRATLEDVQRLHPEGRADFSRMMTDMVSGVNESDQLSNVNMQQEYQAQFEDYANTQETNDTPMFRFGKDAGVANFYGIESGENGMNPEPGEMGQLPLGAMDFLDGFDMEDFLPSHQFGIPMI